MTSEKRRVLVLAGSQAVMLTVVVLAFTLGAILGHELAADKSLATLPNALMVIGTAVATVPASFLIRRLGWRGAFLVGTGLGLAGGLLGFYALHTGSFMLFTLAYGLLGMYQSFGNYHRFAAAEAASEAFRGRAIAWVLAGGVVAAVAGPQLAEWGESLFGTARYTGAFALVVLLAVSASLILFFLDLGRPSVAVDASPARPLTAIARQPAFFVALAAAAIGYGAMVLAMTAAPLAMVAHHHHGVGDAAFVIQLHVLGMFLPSFVTGTLIQRFGLTRIMGAGVLLLAGHILIALSGVAVAHFVSALVLLGIGWNFLYVGGTTLLTESYRPSERAKTQAVNDFAVFGVVAAASLSAGWLLHHFGWQAVNYAMLPFLALIGGLIVWYGFRRRADRAATPEYAVTKSLT